MTIIKGQVREKRGKFCLAYSKPPFVQVEVPPSTVTVEEVEVGDGFVPVFVPDEKVPKPTKMEIRSATMIL